MRLPHPRLNGKACLGTSPQRKGELGLAACLAWASRPAISNSTEAVGVRIRSVGSLHQSVGDLEPLGHLRLSLAGSWDPGAKVAEAAAATVGVREELLKKLDVREEPWSGWASDSYDLRRGKTGMEHGDETSNGSAIPRVHARSGSVYESSTAGV